MSQQERWQLAGNASEVYDRYLVPAVFQPWADILTQLARLEPGDRVLDVACGTGVVARLAAQQVGPSGQVTGLDLNPGMIEAARAVPMPSGTSIIWQEGNANAMPFTDGTFDVVFCQLGLQFFPDRLAAVQEMHRVLVSGGRLALLVWRDIAHSPGFAAFAEALNRHVSAEAAGIMHSPFVFGDATDALQTLLTQAGFHDVTVRFDVRMVRFSSPEALVQYYAAGSPLASHVAQVDKAIREAVIKDVGAALGSYVDDEGLAFPIEGHLVLAQA